MKEVTSITQYWEVDRQPIPYVPSLANNIFNYTGSVIAPEWEHFSPSEITIGGTYEATQPGRYIATFTPKDDYTWSDGCTDTRLVLWKIISIAIPLPYQYGTLTYTGSVQHPAWINYDPAKMRLTGTTSATEAGTYKATFTLTGNNTWNDGSTHPHDVSWTINPKRISFDGFVTQRSFEYTGQEIHFPNKNPDLYVLSGDVSGVEQGLYEVLVSPSSNYTWLDGTTEPKVVQWGIAAPGYRWFFPDEPDYPETSIVSPGDPRYPQKAVANPNYGKNIVSTDPDYPADGDGKAITPTITTYGQQRCVGSGVIAQYVRNGSYYLTNAPKAFTTSSKFYPGQYQFMFSPSKSPGGNSIGAYMTVAGVRTGADPYWSNTVTITREQYLTFTPACVATSGWSGFNTIWYYYREVYTKDNPAYIAIRPKTISVDNGTDPVTVKNEGPVHLPLHPLGVPSQSTPLTYNGENQSPAWTSYDSDYLKIGGITSAANAGTYEATFTPTNGGVWNDGFIGPRTVSWSIGRLAVNAPTAAAPLGYTGSSQSPTWDGFDTSKFTIGGTTSATNIGTYYATFTPKDNYCWADGTYGPKNVEWTIRQLTVAFDLGAIIPQRSYQYTGEEIHLGVVESDSYAVTGNLVATDCGIYEVTITPINGYTWEDGSVEPKVVQWGIAEAGNRYIFPDEEDYPEISVSFPGDPNYPKKEVPNPDYGKDLYPGDPYYPADGDGEPISPEMAAEPKTVTFYPNCAQYPAGVQCIYNNPTRRITLDPGTYKFTWSLQAQAYLRSDLGEKSPPLDAVITYDKTTTVTICPGYVYYYGTTSSSTSQPMSSFEKPYTCTITGTVKDGYRSSTIMVDDGVCAITATNSGPIQVPDTSVASMSVPTQRGTLTYSGTAISPSWNNYNASAMNVAGEISATDAGVHSVTFTPRKGCTWADGTTKSKVVNWTIDPAQGELAVAPESLYFKDLGEKYKQTLTATSNIPADVQAQPEDTSIVTVSVTGKNVTVTPVAYGNTAVNVGIPGGNNFVSPVSISCPVFVTAPIDPKTLTASQIQEYISQGMGPSVFAVGDTASVTCNQTMTAANGSTIQLSTLYPHILGFDHNQPTEGTGHYVDFEWPCIATSGGGFPMTSSTSTSGGWAQSRMRTSTCPTFFTKLPSDWQDVIVEAPKYASSVDAATSDKIWILSYYEVSGSSIRGEGAVQQRYPYYMNGRSLIRYTTAVYGTACCWWLRTVENVESFSIINQNGGHSNYYPNYAHSGGIAIGFCPCARIA